MGTFEYNVKVQAKDSAEAVRILTALMDIKKSMSADDLILFARKVKENPTLIQKAKLFL